MSNVVRFTGGRKSAAQAEVFSDLEWVPIKPREEREASDDEW